MTGKVHTLAPQSSAVRDPERHTSAVETLPLTPSLFEFSADRAALADLDCR